MQIPWPIMRRMQELMERHAFRHHVDSEHAFRPSWISWSDGSSSPTSPPSDDGSPTSAGGASMQSSSAGTWSEPCIDAGVGREVGELEPCFDAPSLDEGQEPCSDTTSEAGTWSEHGCRAASATASMHQVAASATASMHQVAASATASMQARPTFLPHAELYEEILESVDLDLDSALEMCFWLFWHTCTVTGTQHSSFSNDDLNDDVNDIAVPVTAAASGSDPSVAPVDPSTLVAVPVSAAASGSVPSVALTWPSTMENLEQLMSAWLEEQATMPTLTPGQTASIIHVLNFADIHNDINPMMYAVLCGVPDSSTGACSPWGPSLSTGMMYWAMQWANNHQDGWWLRQSPLRWGWFLLPSDCSWRSAMVPPSTGDFKWLPCVYIICNGVPYMLCIFLLIRLARMWRCHIDRLVEWS